MAVPGRRNGLNDDDGDENAFFEDEILMELQDSDSLHLSDLATASHLAGLHALRLTLGSQLLFLFFSEFWPSLRYDYFPNPSIAFCLVS